MPEADLANHALVHGRKILPPCRRAWKQDIGQFLVRAFPVFASRSLFSYEGEQTIQLGQHEYESTSVTRWVGPTATIKSWCVSARSGKLLVDWLSTLVGAGGSLALIDGQDEEDETMMANGSLSTLLSRIWKDKYTSKDTT